MNHPERDAVITRAEQPDFWRCKTCGCLWRDNHEYGDESVSLGSAKQTSCTECEMKGSAEACEPLYRRPDDLLSLVRSLEARVKEQDENHSVTFKRFIAEGLRADGAEAERDKAGAAVTSLTRERDKLKREHFSMSEQLLKQSRTLADAEALVSSLTHQVEQMKGEKR